MTPASGMYPHLDRFQIMKRERMRLLLEEIKEAGTIPVKKFLGSIAVHYGIRRATSWEYIRDYVDAGLITVENNVIKYVPESND